MASPLRRRRPAAIRSAVAAGLERAAAFGPLAGPYFTEFHRLCPWNPPAEL